MMQSSTASASQFPKESRNLYCLLLIFVLFLLFLLSIPLSSPTPTHPSSAVPPLLLPSAASSAPPPPSLAYLLTSSSSSSSDADRLLRLLLATYHPNNLYLLLHDRAAPRSQRERLARAVRTMPVVRSARNVHVVGEPGFANPRGASALACLLHGAAMLLRLGSAWDWFVTLDASDYPLVTQDDILHVFSYIPRDLNFIQHSSYLGWKESRRIRPIIVDPGLYLSSRTDVFYATQKRDLPNAYRLFTGSSSVILSRKFMEYIILGTDNLPRTLLMYFSNMPSPHLNYFHTVLCNSPKFSNTVINDHLHYLLQNETLALTLDDMENMTRSGLAFGSGFKKDSPVLDRIDSEILNRGPRSLVPGGWCLGGEHGDPCTVWGSPDLLRPSPRSNDLANLIASLLSSENFHAKQCNIWDN